MLIVEESLELIRTENNGINFPLEFLELPAECASTETYNWNIVNHGRLQ